MTARLWGLGMAQAAVTEKHTFQHSKYKTFRMLGMYTVDAKDYCMSHRTFGSHTKIIIRLQCITVLNNLGEIFKEWSNF